MYTQRYMRFAIWCQFVNCSKITINIMEHEIIYKKKHPAKVGRKYITF